MDMVWHHDPSQLQVPLTLKELQSLADHGRVIRTFQHATAMPFVQRMLDPGGKAPVVFGFNIRCPGRRVRPKPVGPFALPLGQEFGGQ